MKYAGADWLGAMLGVELTALAAEAADVLGQVYRGIYHLPKSNWEPDRWSDYHCVWATVYGRMASVDLWHLKLTFHRRKRIGEHQYQVCPRLKDHVERIRKHFGLPEVAE